jgi:hypothetical protein
MLELTSLVHRGGINIYGRFGVQIWTPETWEVLRGFLQSITPQQTHQRNNLPPTQAYILSLSYLSRLSSEITAELTRSDTNRDRIFSPAGEQWKFMVKWHLPSIEQDVSPSKSENGSNSERHIWLKKRTWNHKYSSGMKIHYFMKTSPSFRRHYKIQASL